MKNLIAVLCAALVLAGCQTTTPEARLAGHKTACAGYGFKDGTDAYAACMMQMDRDAANEDRRKRQVIADAFSDMGKSMQQPQRVTCNTYGTARPSYGTVYGQSTTTCY